MEDFLPGLSIGPTKFRTAVHDQYMMLVASNSFGPNPPSFPLLMRRAIDAVHYQYHVDGGFAVVDEAIEKVLETGESVL